MKVIYIEDYLCRTGPASLVIKRLSWVRVSCYDNLIEDQLSGKAHIRLTFPGIVEAGARCKSR